MTAPQTADEVLRIHQPRRALVALAELLVAAAAIWAAFWFWPRGVATITNVLENGVTQDSTRFFGNWMAGAIGFGTLAALLVLDALRQIVLAVRARPRRRQAGQHELDLQETPS